MVVKYRVPFIIIIIIVFVFSFLATRTAHTREPILTHDTHVVWRKEVPSKQVFFEILTFWGQFPRKPQKFGWQ